ncbi:MAG TPA: MerR family transcriptional regulator [Solimonas sp.]|nr:MerR family transcriptional regulator [Solimonas sp.]
MPAPARKKSDRPTPKATPAPAEFTIDELARQAGTTVRNARAYQEKGLVPPPERRGRQGVYTDAHLARLRLIGRLLERGYTLANIAELIAAWEQGRELHAVLGLESELTQPWSKEQAAYLSLPELLKMFDGKISPSDIARTLELGLVEREGQRFRVPSPRMLQVGAEFTRIGVPLKSLLEIVAKLRGNVARVANELVQLIVLMVDRYGAGQLPPAEDVPQLAALIHRLRPLADQAIESEVSRAMERALAQFLGDRIGLVMDELARAGQAKA